MQYTYKEIMQAVREYRLVKAFRDNDDRIETELSAVLLRNGNYTDEDTGEKITSPELAYTMSETQYNAFLQERYEHEKKLHIADPRGWQHCAPQRHAERLHQIETKLIDMVLSVLDRTNPVEADALREGCIRNYSTRQKVIEQALKMFDAARRAAQTA